MPPPTTLLRFLAFVCYAIDCYFFAKFWFCLHTNTLSFDMFFLAQKRVAYNKVVAAYSNKHPVCG